MIPEQYANRIEISEKATSRLYTIMEVFNKDYDLERYVKSESKGYVTDTYKHTIRDLREWEVNHYKGFYSDLDYTSASVVIRQNNIIGEENIKNKYLEMKNFCMRGDLYKEITEIPYGYLSEIHEIDIEYNRTAVLVAEFFSDGRWSESCYIINHDNNIAYKSNIGDYQYFRDEYIHDKDNKFKFEMKSFTFNEEKETKKHLDNLFKDKKDMYNEPFIKDEEDLEDETEEGI